MSHWKYYLKDGDYSWSSGIQIEKDVSFRDAYGREWLYICEDGVITLRQHYAWDGCSPTVRLCDWFYMGASDGTMSTTTRQPKTYFASLVHDGLYQFRFHPDMPFTRKQMDQMFLALLDESGFSLKYVYYIVVRALGGVYNRFSRWLHH